ncbi:MAG: DUF2163 domain-containing protein [Pseudomonadota bacterium]
MRDIPGTLKQSLLGGVTTLARCWRLERRDGVIMGFTDHDRHLSFDGVSYGAVSGLDAGAIERSTGLSVDTHTVAGALQSEKISEADIQRGFFDSAEVQLWLVDWQNVQNRLLLSTGHLGEIRRTETAFEAEIVGLAEQLNQPVGRVYHHRCDLRLGEARCGIDTDSPEFKGQGVVTEVSGAQRFVASNLDTFTANWFSEGAIAWTSGANALSSGQVKTHLINDGLVRLELWQAPGLKIAVGDSFDIVAGCDKRSETCRLKFSNFLNFRGFPHMPGDDFAAGYPSGGGHDGGSLLRG